MKTSWLISLGMLLAFWANPGVAADDSDLPIAFMPITINAKPAYLFLDTAFPYSGALDSATKRLGLKNEGTWADLADISVRISEPVAVQSAGQTNTTTMPIMHLPWWVKMLLHLTPYHLDGVLGWPEIRDNILVFDSNQHTIRRVDKLPSETSGWLKLKVVPDDFLLLEVPLADGETGLLGLDTLEISPTAVMLSAGPWKEWKATHPHSPKTNEIKIGPLTLTDVTVKELPTGEANDWLYEIPGVNAVWKLGYPALTRLDLVVDAKNGWAYLNPKPPLATTNHLAKDENWRVAGNVRVFNDNFCVYSAWYKWWNGDLGGAEADYQESLKLNPRNADAWSGWGSVREVRGDFAGAVSNYDRVIALRPRNSEWERLYRQTLLWRLGGPPMAAAKSVVETNQAASPVVLDSVVVYATQGGGNKRWARTIHLYLDGSMDDHKLLELAKHSDGEVKAAEQKAQAEYYIGMVRLGKGDLAGARSWLQKCRKAGMKDDVEYFFAIAELARLDQGAQR